MKIALNTKRNWLVYVAILIIAAGTAMASTTGTVKNTGHTQSAAAANASAGKPQAKPINLHVRPASIREYQTWQFDPDNGVAHTECRLKLGLWITPPADQKVLSYTMWIDKLITGSGRDLARGGLDVGTLEKDNEGKTVGSVSITTRGVVTALKKLQGHVKVRLAVSKDQSITIQPISKYLDKRIDLPKVGPNAWVYLSRPKAHPGLVRVGMSDHTRQLIKQVRFLTNSGALSAVKRESHWVHPTFQAKLSNDGQIDIRFWGKMKTVTVPFTLKNIPTPMSPGVVNTAVTAKAVPVAPESKVK